LCQRKIEMISCRKLRAGTGEAVNRSCIGCGGDGNRHRWATQPPHAPPTDFQCVGHNVCKGFGLPARQGNVNERRDHSHHGPRQNEMGFDPPTHPVRSQGGGTCRSFVYIPRNLVQNRGFRSAPKSPLIRKPPKQTAPPRVPPPSSPVWNREESSNGAERYGSSWPRFDR
jgi:hypothetical protein